MERLSSLAALVTVLATVLVTEASNTRCYQCREVTQLEGNAKFYRKRATVLKSQGWILPCSDESFVEHLQVRQNFLINQLYSVA